MEPQPGDRQGAAPTAASRQTAKPTANATANPTTLHPNRRRFTIAEYHHLIEHHTLHPSERTELICGEIHQMVAKGTRHAACCRRWLRVLPPLLPETVWLQCQDPVELPNATEPEPDFAIIRQREGDYLQGHPQPDDIVLIIEIADTSLSYDLQTKLPLYAEAGIGVYWVVNLVAERLEVYREPYQERSGRYGYRLRQIVLPGERVALPVGEAIEIDLATVFPR